MSIERSSLSEIMYFTPDGTLRLDTSNDVIRKVRRDYLSASTMNSMHGCRASYLADRVLKIPGDAFSATESGTAAHAVLEELYQRAPDERTPEVAGQILLSLHESHPEVIMPPAERYAEWVDDVWVKLRGEFALNDPSAIQVYAVEREVKDVAVAGVPFLGRIDRTDVVGDGLQVVDYKTGKVPNDYAVKNFGDDGGDQQVLYVLALEAAGEHPVGAELHYTKYSDDQLPKRRPVDLSPAVRERVTLKYTSAWDAFRRITDDGVAETSPGGLCNWCDLALSCPVSIAGKKKPLATPGALASEGVVEVFPRRTVRPTPDKGSPS